MMDYPMSTGQGLTTNLPEQQSLQGEIAELRSVIREIKNRVIEGSSQIDNVEKNPQAAHRLINIKNSITDIKRECVDILGALMLL